MRDRGDGLAEEPRSPRRRCVGWAIPNGQIEAVRTEIAHRVVGRYPDVDVRVPLQELPEARQEPETGHPDAGSDGHGGGSGADLDGADHVLELLHDPVRQTEQPFAVRREG